MNTKNYVRANGAGQGRRWTYLTLDELEHWLGIVIFMGVFSALAIRDYWADEAVRPDYNLQSTMAHLWFEQIKLHLHVYDQDNDRSKDDFFEKWNPLMDEVRQEFKER